MKNSWFKHWNTAHEGQTIATLWAENDTETIAFYWTLLEIVSRWEKEESRGEVELNLATFRLKLGMKSQRSRKLLTKISQRFQINLTWISDESFKLLIPNWLELQETRGGKRQPKTDQSAARSKKREVRSKREEVRSKNEDTDISFGELLLEAPDTGKKSLGSRIFEAYSHAFKNRYGVEPVRNAKVNKNCQEIGNRLGEDAIEVTKFFISHNDSFYLKTQHPIGSLLRDAESLHTQWKRGRQVTGQDIRNFERTNSQLQAGEMAAKYFEDKENDK